jgi:hypothetical protein
MTTGRRGSEPDLRFGRALHLYARSTYRKSRPDTRRGSTIYSRQAMHQLELARVSERFAFCSSNTAISWQFVGHVFRDYPHPRSRRPTRAFAYCYASCFRREHVPLSIIVPEEIKCNPVFRPRYFSAYVMRASRRLSRLTRIDIVGASARML